VLCLGVAYTSLRQRALLCKQLVEDDIDIRGVMYGDGALRPDPIQALAFCAVGVILI
jgi:hypothetical protein